jgi:dihydrofolate reductase
MFSIIAAIGRNRELGYANTLLWKLPADMKRFRTLTLGHTVIMGRKTFESLPNGALPERKNVIITHADNIKHENCLIINDLQTALKLLKKDSEEVFIIGGAGIYAQAIKNVDKMYITIVWQDFPEADVFFPLIDEYQWIIESKFDYQADERNQFDYSFITYVRKI